MIKLTRLNQQTIAINPDHIAWVEVSPDTTLFLIGGDKVIVRETLDDLIGCVIAFRQALRSGASRVVGAVEGDPPLAVLPLSEGGRSVHPRSGAPGSRR